MKRRLLVLGLTGCMISQLLGGCQVKENISNQPESLVQQGKPENFNESGLPIVNEPITLRVAAKKRSDVPDFSTMQFFQELEKETNIKIEWELVPEEGWKEKKSLIFASNGLPDVFFGNGVLESTEIVKYGSQGLLIPLNDYYDNYGENLKRMEAEIPSFRKTATTPDGNIYALPSVNGAAHTTQCALFINHDWLKKTGMDIPKTTDEFENMLIAFKTAGDLNENGNADELPFTFKFKNVDGVNGCGAMFGAFGRIDNTSHLVVEDSKVIFTAQEEEYKAAVSWFHKLVEEGLVDIEAFTQDTSVTHAKIKNDPMIVGAAPFWNLSWATGDMESDKWVAIPPLAGPDGDQLWDQNDTTVTDLGAFAISKDCKYPEAAFRLADYLYNDKVAMESFFGPLDVTIEKGADGAYTPIPQPEGMTEQEFRLQYAPVFNGIYAIPQSTFEKEYTNLAVSVYEKNVVLNKELYAPYQTANYYPKLYFTPEEVEKISAIKTGLQDYVAEMTADWMLNGGIEDDWDSYLKELKNMGLDEYLSIHQTAYDRYTAN